MFINLNPNIKPMALNRNINNSYFNRSVGSDSVEISFKRKKKDLDKQTIKPGFKDLSDPSVQSQIISQARVFAEQARTKANVVVGGQQQSK